MGWVERICLTRASSAGVDPVQWAATVRWSEGGGLATEITAPCVYPFEIGSLVLGLLESDWGPLDLWTWIVTH
jgi:hypothetical protein